MGGKEKNVIEKEVYKEGERQGNEESRRI